MKIKMIKKQTIFSMLLCCVFLSVFLFSKKASAGDINSAEADLISTVSAPFAYNGATYQVMDSYIGQGRQKLAKDNVDLSASEAKSYAAQFQNSYAELVEQGYCNKISEDADKKVTPTSRPLDDTKKEMLQKLLGKPKSEKSEKTETAKTEKNQSEQNSTAVTATPTASAAVDDNDTWSEEEEDLGEELQITEDDLKYAKKSQLNVTVDKKEIKISKTPQNNKKSKNIVSRIVKLNVIRIACIIVGVITVLTMAGIGLYLLWHYRKKKKARKVRTGLAIAAGVALTGWCALLLAVIGLKCGVYSKDVIHREMMESNYYAGVTQVLRKETGNILEKYQYPKSLSTEAVKLADVYIEGKQYVDKLLAGSKDAQIDTSRIDKTVRSVITAYQQNNAIQSEDGSTQQMQQDIAQMYQSLLAFPLGEEIVESQTTFITWFYFAVIGGILSALLFIILLYKMYGYPHKVVRVFIAAITSSSCAAFILSLIEKVRKPYADIRTSPVYYQDFLIKYIDRDIRIFIYLSLVGILLGVVLFIWKRYLHMEYAE